MDASKIILDDAAVEEIQKLKNGFFRQVLSKLGVILSRKGADPDGNFRVTLDDVHAAVREVAEEPEAWVERESPKDVANAR